MLISCIHCNSPISDIHACCPTCGTRYHSEKDLDSEVALFGADYIRYIVAPYNAYRGELIDGISELLTFDRKFNIHPIKGNNWFWKAKKDIFSKLPTELWVLATRDYERDYNLCKEIEDLRDSGIESVRYIDVELNYFGIDMVNVRLVDKKSKEILLYATCSTRSFDFFRRFTQGG